MIQIFVICSLSVKGVLGANHTIKPGTEMFYNQPEKLIATQI